MRKLWTIGGNEKFLVDDRTTIPIEVSSLWLLVNSWPWSYDMSEAVERSLGLPDRSDAPTRHLVLKVFYTMWDSPPKNTDSNLYAWITKDGLIWRRHSTGALCAEIRDIVWKHELEL